MENYSGRPIQKITASGRPINVCPQCGSIYLFQGQCEMCGFAIAKNPYLKENFSTCFDLLANPIDEEEREQKLKLHLKLIVRYGLTFKEEDIPPLLKVDCLWTGYYLRKGGFLNSDIEIFAAQLEGSSLRESFENGVALATSTEEKRISALNLKKEVWARRSLWLLIFFTATLLIFFFRNKVFESII